MKKNTLKSLQYQRIQRKKSFKKNNKARNKKKSRSRGKQINRQNNSSNFIPAKWLRKSISLTAPSNFSLSEDVENVIQFIELFKSYSKLNDVYNKVDLDLRSVERIDTATISLLLSTIKELGIYDITVGGNLPNNLYCHQFVLDSGFLEHMAVMSETLKTKIRKSDPDERNMMIMNGKDKTNHREIGRIIKESVKKLTGFDAHYKPLYGVIGEMNINALEHAYKGKKHWVFAVRYDKENEKIKFTFTDNGYGIYKTLNKRLGLKVFETLGLKDEKDIVNGMFLEEYSSRFKGQYNRNRGLPAIRNLQDENKIDNLTLVTNGVYINFDNGTKIDLDSNFSGTFYYWELSKNTYEKTTRGY